MSTLKQKSISLARQALRRTWKSVALRELTFGEALNYRVPLEIFERDELER